MASRARQDGFINSEVLAVGIDVAKSRHVVVLRCREGFRSAPIGIANDRAGFEQLIDRVETIIAATKGEVFALEPATGKILWNNKLKGLGTGLVTIASAAQIPAIARRKQQDDAAAAAAGAAAAG